VPLGAVVDEVALPAKPENVAVIFSCGCRTCGFVGEPRNCH
jgi:hypothetical protein